MKASIFCMEFQILWHNTIDLVLNSGPGARESWRRRVHPPTVWPPKSSLESVA